ncbi:hypothetical protein NDU88_007311 [Pleurodeles waltl]|uniref:Uncharacterized protein n=1 Tax=Pleurodeles waltl TaxID=8319 RepID=A0AAV7N5J5_PLEWA|nr:hypothetical protein NDU88_007311 [Pleurodeles waltl]
MEEDQVVEPQDDLERMIAHMRAEALKRGKDWLRAKMEDKEEGMQNAATPISQDLSPVIEESVKGSPLPPPKTSKHRRTEGGAVKKTPKKAKGTDRPPHHQPTGSHLRTARRTHQLRGNSAGLGVANAEKGANPGRAEKSNPPVGRVSGKGQNSMGDPTAAWGTPTRAASALIASSDARARSAVNRILAEPKKEKCNISQTATHLYDQ